MDWFLNMLKYFSDINADSMSKLGRSSIVRLLAYPDRIIDATTGQASLSDPTEFVMRAVFIPFAAYRFGRVFGEMLERQFKGEHFVGEALLFVDEQWLASNNIIIDTEMDRISHDGIQYKLVRAGDYKHYFNVSIYLCQRVAETYDE
jgi:hypothetical protein